MGEHVCPFCKNEKVSDPKAVCRSCTLRFGRQAIELNGYHVDGEVVGSTSSTETKEVVPAAKRLFLRAEEHADVVVTAGAYTIIAALAVFAPTSLAILALPCAMAGWGVAEETLVRWGRSVPTTSCGRAALSLATGLLTAPLVLGRVAQHKATALIHNIAARLEH